MSSAIATRRRTLASAAQPLDSDLTAIAALSTTSFGRAFLALADAAAGRTALGLGTAATHATGDYDAAGAAAAAQAASQPLDSDLTAIAALATTTYGRGLLTDADAAAFTTRLTGLLNASYQPLDSDLTAIAALSTTSFGRSLLTQADAATALVTLGAAVAPRFVQIAGLWYPNDLQDGSVNNGTTVLNTVYYTPFIPSATHTFVKIGSNVAIGGTGGVLRFGIWNDDGTGKPGTLIVDAGTAASTGTGAVTKTISQALTAGTLYWLGVVSQSGSVEPDLHLSSKRQTTFIGSRNVLSNSTATNTCGYKETSVTGAFGGSATPTANGDSSTQFLVQVQA